MPTFVQLSRGLLSKLEQEYPANENTTRVDTTPDKVLFDYEMALYAQSRQGTKSLNMRSPQLKRELERLAERGAGHIIEWNGVKFQFIQGTNFQSYDSKCHS